MELFNFNYKQSDLISVCKDFAHVYFSLIITCWCSFCTPSPPYQGSSRSSSLSVMQTHPTMLRHKPLQHLSPPLLLLLLQCVSSSSSEFPCWGKRGLDWQEERRQWGCDTTMAGSNLRLMQINEKHHQRSRNNYTNIPDEDVNTYHKQCRGTFKRIPLWTKITKTFGNSTHQSGRNRFQMVGFSSFARHALACVCNASWLEMRPGFYS